MKQSWLGQFSSKNEIEGCWEGSTANCLLRPCSVFLSASHTEVNKSVLALIDIINCYIFNSVNRLWRKDIQLHLDVANKALHGSGS